MTNHIIWALSTLIIVLTVILLYLYRKYKNLMVRTHKTIAFENKKNYYRELFADVVKHFIREVEFSLRIELSEGAKNMFISPLWEYYGFVEFESGSAPYRYRDLEKAIDRLEKDKEIWQASIRMVLDSIYFTPAYFDLDPSDPFRIPLTRTSFSIINGFYSRFCDIPPFCRPTR